MTDRIPTRKLGFVFEGTIYLSDSFTLLRNKVLEVGAHRINGEEGTGVDVRKIVRPLPQDTLRFLTTAFPTYDVLYLDEDGSYSTTADLQEKDTREANPLAELLEEIHVRTCKLSLDYPCTGEDAGEYGQELFDAGDVAGLDELLRVLHLEDEDSTANGPELDALIYPGLVDRAIYPPVVEPELDDEFEVGGDAAEIAALFGAKLVEDESLEDGELELDLSDEEGSFSEFKARENIAQGWKVGDPVRVTRGPFKGRIGRVEGIARGIEVRVENSFLCVVSAGELETQRRNSTLAADRIVGGDELTKLIEEPKLWIGGRTSALIGVKNTFKVGDRVDIPQFPGWNGSTVVEVNVPGTFQVRVKSELKGPGLFSLDELVLAPDSEYEVGFSRFYHSETPDEWPAVARRIRLTLAAGRRVVLEPCFIDRPNGYYVHVTADPEDVS